jgi:autotransporter-associated beta strand protein
VNDRFSSGFPSAPVANTSPDFIGAGLDWSGVGWASNNARKSFALISPQHYLVARHFGGAATVVFNDASSNNLSASQSTVTPTNFGMILNGNPDLSVGKLAQSLPRTRIPARYPVIDLNSSSSSNTFSNYAGQQMVLYGHGGLGTINSPRLHSTQILTFLTTITEAHRPLLSTREIIPKTDTSDEIVLEGLEDQDSGGPSFILWTSPAGSREPALVGNHAAVNDTRNFDNFLGTFEVINRLGEMLRPDGRALRVAGNPAGTWEGGGESPLSPSNLSSNQNWDGVYSDQYVRFNAAETDYPSPLVNQNMALRGLYFLPTASTTDSFTFTGTNVLTIGRGGVVNYDNSPQLFNAPLRLGADQVWHPGPGGVTAANLNTNGFLLEMDQESTLTFTGAVTGTGGLAVGRGLMILQGNSTYTGDTWVHEGELRVNGSISASPNVRTGPGGVLTGTGAVANIRGAGTVRPHPGTLTATQAIPAEGLNFSFTFPSQTLAGNPALRLSGATPFSASLSASNLVEILFEAGPLVAGQTYRGGFFTDASSNFIGSIENAEWVFQVMDSGGPVSVPEGLEILLSTESAQLDTGGIPVDGQVLVLSVISTDEPAPYDTWADSAFPDGTPEEDKDPLASANDIGLINLLAYAHRIDPVNPDITRFPFALMDEGDFVLRFRRNSSASDLNFLVDSTLSLFPADWQPVAAVPEIVDPDTDNDEAAELVEVRLPVGTGHPALFLRVRVEQLDL